MEQRITRPGYTTADYMTELPAPVEIAYHGTATHVLRWYSRHERSWVVSYSDAQGAQMGVSEYVGTVEDAIAWRDYLIQLATPTTATAEPTR